MDLHTKDAAVIILIVGVVLGVVVYRRFGGTRAARRRPEYLEKYADHVMAACAGASSSAPAITKIAERYKDEATREQITWGELFTVEADLLANQSDVAIRRRAWSLRDKFREVVGTRQYDNYLLSNPPNENDPDADISLLRADLDRLLAALHWSYALIPVRERVRAQIITFVSAQIAVWALVAAGLLLWAALYGQALLATVLLVMLAGAIGGFVSLLRRIQLVPTGGDPLLNIFELENGKVSLYLAPLSGALFALVLFLIFMGELVQGSLFPDLGNLRLKLKEFEWSGQEIVHTQYAKLLVWAFIAGFAERLVPDTLARLTERGEEASAAARTAPPAGQASVTQGAHLPVRPRPPLAVDPKPAANTSEAVKLADLLDAAEGEQVAFIGPAESSSRQGLVAVLGSEKVNDIDIAKGAGATLFDAFLVETMPSAANLSALAHAIQLALKPGGRVVAVVSTSAGLFDADAQMQADQGEVGPALLEKAMAENGFVVQQRAERLSSDETTVKWASVFVKPL